MSRSSAPKAALADYLPLELRDVRNPKTQIPEIARDANLVGAIEAAVNEVPTTHRLLCCDSRDMGLATESVHLVLTSPPYWTLKEYPDREGQLGAVADYEGFLEELDRVWRQCFDSLVPGGRVVCVVGDVCLSRRRNGRHAVVPLHASIQEHCRGIGFDNLAPIIWYKIANAAYEVEGGSGFLGKPYEPNAVIKNDIEFVLNERKPGGYRSPSLAARLLSVIPAERHGEWFRQVWTDIPGASTRDHPAPFRLELAERVVRMFSFVGDTVLDPFMGTGTTNMAAARWGRNSVGFEVEPEYHSMAAGRLREMSTDLFGKVTVDTHPPGAPADD